MLKLNVEALKTTIGQYDVIRTAGKLRKVDELVHADLPMGVGELCRIVTSDRLITAEALAVDGHQVKLAPFDHVHGLQAGMRVLRGGPMPSTLVGDTLLGRVLDPLCRPLDDGPAIRGARRRSLAAAPPKPMSRQLIEKPFHTKQRVIDSVLTIGQGQRIGLFAGSGVGKSTLLGQIAQHSSADVNVVILVGERGREVRPFVEQSLGPAGLARSVVLVATADQPPLLRIRCVEAGITIAEAFRDEGKNVLLMMDSVTRLAAARRELGLLLGEPPSARGYTPSVFQLLAQLLERLGPGDEGAITALLTVLVDGDDTNEPLSDAVRSIVDGHIVLDRTIAQQGRYPAVNIAASVSRLFNEVTSPEHRAAGLALREILAAYAEVEQLLLFGAYVRGSSPKADRAIDLMPAVRAFLSQRPGEATEFANTVAKLRSLTQSWMDVR